MNITELRKELMASKKTDISKSKVLQAILALALGIAKNDKNREVQDADIIQAVKKEMKMAQQSKDSGAPYSEKTFDICKSFLPKEISTEELTNFIQNEIENLPNISMKMMGVIMKEISNKFGDAVNKGIASKIIKSKLS